MIRVRCFIEYTTFVYLHNVYIYIFISIPQLPRYTDTVCPNFQRIYLLLLYYITYECIYYRNCTRKSENTKCLYKINLQYRKVEKFPKAYIRITLL